MAGSHLRLSLIVTLGVVSALSGAEVHEQTRADGRAKLRFQADKIDKGKVFVALSSTPTLTLSIEGQVPVQIDGDVKDLLTKQEHNITVTNAWSSMQHTPPKTTKLPDGRERWEVTFTLDPRKHGDDYPPLQVVPISFREGPGGTLHKVEWDAIPIVITTRVDNPDKPSLSQLRDITPIEPTGAAPRKWWVWGLMGLGVVLLAAAVVMSAWQLVRRLSGGGVALPPEQWALRELDKVEAQRLPSSGQVERYHTLLSDVVRYYLERRFRLRAPQQTTAEFLATMQSWPLLPATQQAILRDFLERCDLVKFAQVKPTPEECAALGAVARAFVEQTQAVEVKSA